MIATVGPEDRVSLSTTKLALGIIRAAQGRDEEAEELMREAVDGLEMFQYYAAELEALSVLSGFLRSRGREDEAAGLDERKADLESRRSDPLASGAGA